MDEIEKLRKILNNIELLIKNDSNKNNLFLEAIIQDIKESRIKIETYLSIFNIVSDNLENHNSQNNQLQSLLNDYFKNSKMVDDINNEEYEHNKFISSILPIIFILKNIYDKVNS
jgi:hypothetical protein